MKLMIDDKHPSMPWDEVDNIVFDVGNVLLAFVPQQILDDYVPEAPELHPLLTERIFRSPYWCMRDHGTATLEEAIAGMTGRNAAIAPYVRRVMENWVEMKHVIDEGVQTLMTCKAKGKKLYVLSNYADDAFAVAEEKYRFFDLFDGKIISGRVKQIKPEQAIYRCVTDTFGLDPARTLFIDDTPANIEGALEAGWEGFCYTHPGKMADFFGA